MVVHNNQVKRDSSFSTLFSVHIMIHTFPQICSIQLDLDVRIKKQGKNCIPVKLFIQYHHIFLPTLCDIINTCFTSGKFPDCLKHAVITPVFKKSDRTDYHNYRPIYQYFQFYLKFLKDSYIIDYSNILYLDLF